MGGLDGFLDCISDMCPGPGTDDLIWATQQLKYDMMFTDDGKFDSDALLSDIGITGVQKVNVDDMSVKMVDMKIASEEKMERQVTALFKQVKLDEKKEYLGKISKYF